MSITIFTFHDTFLYLFIDHKIMLRRIQSSKYFVGWRGGSHAHNQKCIFEQVIVSKQPRISMPMIQNNFISSSSLQRRMAGVTTLERGSRNSAESRMFFKDASGNIVSPFHDIPMLASKDMRFS